MTNSHTSFFFSDIVGYSKMVERDESLAHRMLKENNKIIKESVIANDGRVVKYIGDSVFAVFESPDNACIASLKIQDNLKQRNSLSRKDERIHIRLGIHTGDALWENEDLFGNDINIASRIESIAQPDYVFISDAILQNVNSPSNYHARQIDNVKLKNIQIPQTLHKLYPSKKEWEQESAAELAEALIETGVKFIDAANIQDDDTKSIGILVFKSLGDPFYGYGLCNDLISEFNRISQVYVSDIQDVIQYKDSDIAPPNIGRKLEVDNIIDGVCRIENDRIHLSIRMMSLKTGKTIWKEELSDLTANLNALRGTIVKKVLEVLDVKVPDFILEKMSKGMTANPEAYKFYHEGLYKIEIVKNTDEYHEAIELFKKAIEHDANFIESYAQLALTTYRLGHMEKAEELLDEAMDMSEDIENEHGRAKLLESVGIINIQSDRYKKAVNYFKKAMRLYVKYEDQLAESKTLNNISTCYINLNDPNKGIEVLEKSIYLKEKLEKDNLLGTSFAQLGNAYRNKFQYGIAINSYRKALGKFTKYNNEYHKGRLLLTLSRCFCDMGIIDQARSYLKRSEEICRRFNEPLIMGKIKYYEGRLLFTEKNYKESISSLNESLTIFRKAGLRKPIIDVLLEMMVIHINFGETDEIRDFIDEYESESQMMSDLGVYKGVIDCIIYYLNAVNKQAQNKELSEIEALLQDANFYEISEIQYMSWWILGKAAKVSGDTVREKRYYSKAVETINQIGDAIGDELEPIGDESYKKYFLNKYPVSEILKYNSHFERAKTV